MIARSLLAQAGHPDGDVGSQETAVEITRRASPEACDYDWRVNNAGVGWSCAVADPAGRPEEVADVIRFSGRGRDLLQRRRAVGGRWFAGLISERAAR